MFVTAYKRLRMPLLVGLALAALPGLSQATHAWGGYHWARTITEFTLKLGDNLTTDDWKSHLATASLDWNSPQEFNTTTPLITTITLGRSTKRTCSMVKGTTQVCNATYGNNGWLGLASINVTGGTHITQGTAKMNDTYFNWARYNNASEKQHVMCQEIAHTFGLGHQDETGKPLNTCMDYYSNTSDADTLSTRPNAHDFDELNIIYAHLDSSTTTVAASTTTAPSAADVDITDDPNSWGTLMRQSANGRSSVYERFNRDGSRTLTHVYWTFEAASRCPSCDHRFESHDRN